MGQVESLEKVFGIVFGKGTGNSICSPNEMKLYMECNVDLLAGHTPWNL